MAEGVTVTRNVRERLKEQADRGIPRTKEEIFWAGCVGLIILSLFVLAIVLLVSLSHPSEYTVLLAVCGAGLYGTYRVCERKHASEVDARLSRVGTRLEELARKRQRQIDEAKAFYTSSEWRLVRKQVVEEQGRVCQRCRNHIIRDDYDLTVDHIKPRSKFPELALDKSNLQVLCRRCNSAKGATYNEASITAQPTDPRQPLP